MVDSITIIFLLLMFISLYILVFFMILTFKNRRELFSYPEPKRDFSITVLIPAYNEEDNIEDTIRHVMDLNYTKNKLEVIVLNDGSTDNTNMKVEKLLKKYRNLKLLDKENSGKADSLNQGVGMAMGELIAVVDADSFPSKDSLLKLSGFFNDENMGAVTSFVTVRNSDESLFGKIQAIEYVIMGWMRKILDFVDSVYVTNGPLSLYRKKFIQRVGGFDLETVTEDIDITWNLMDKGYKTAMCMDADVTTVVPIKIKAWFRQRSRWGLGGLQAVWKYKKSFFRNGMFGAFVLPFVSLSIVISVFSILFSSYIIFNNLASNVVTAGYSISSNAPLVHFENINLNPSVLLFYLGILFFSSIFFYHYILTQSRFYERLTLKRFSQMAFYMIVYLSIYPIIWFHSIYRFLVKDVSW
jgi:cellulose synthase/poly-beta-1,6-N-acetylglucosamine synthase-like glycosyltransferase